MRQLLRGPLAGALGAARLGAALRAPPRLRALASLVPTSGDDASASTADDSEARRALRRPVTREIASETEAVIRDTLLPLNEQYSGPLEEESDKRTPLPFVFLLGNHSSGKSSFINHVLESRVQNTGVAPTDDGFTIIMPGPRDGDQDGPSLVGDPDLGFTGLRSFGPALIHHTQLKVRANLGLDDLMLIDSPGMIDSPTDSLSGRPHGGNLQGSSLQGGARSDRGYDFEGVTRWFAERADVILLFFDPDKPGTTGETLAVLTTALAGMDHKLHIVLNKVDQFKKIHDFARAYGSLCWNLSKVIPRKDLPRIYTMYTPVTTDRGNSGRSLRFQDQHRAPAPHNVADANLSWKSSLADLEASRDDVIAEVRRAPERRVDNMVTHLYDSARQLRMHLEVMEVVRLELRAMRRSTLLTSAAIGSAGFVTSLAALYVMPTMWGFAATLSGSTIAGAAGYSLYANMQLDAKAAELATEAALDGIFRRIYAREMLDNDEFSKSLWIRVKPNLQTAISTIGVRNLRPLAPSHLRDLDEIIDEQVPDLRRKAAPSYHKG